MSAPKQNTLVCLRDGKFIGARADNNYLTYDGFWKTTVQNSLCVREGSVPGTKLITGTFGYGPDAVTGNIYPCEELFPKHPPWTIEKVVSMHNEELSFLNLCTP